ncbi:MAG: hypothetical protein EBV28_09360 [Betaproteobacteria bacterium]|nr:hypothetical protein [Betaproteobacteria bacterium]
MRHPPPHLRGPGLNASELQALIRSRIPVADFMQLEVRLLTPDQVDISAPLEPNRNVHGTLFGGSGTAIALVAAWKPCSRPERRPQGGAAQGTKG